ncbi:glycosyltransferase [Treponema denticola]|uniref:glycosyltransferase n=1 Tax=Treponema denticola TaxID=158 RepID=UPI002103E272|nr:glycosyltransferase [Treponema denticola]
MKKTALVTGGTSKDVPAMACLVMNIKDTNPNLADEIVIFHDGILQKDQKLINEIFPTRFILYELPFKDVSNFGEIVTKYFSPMVFCKYECFKLLNDYECVIWTDYDVVLIDNISSLIANLNRNCAFMTDKKLSIKEMFNQNILQYDISCIDIERKGVCTPLFILKDSLPDYIVYYNKCLQLTKDFAECLHLAEQCVLNILIQQNNICYDNIPYIPYCTHPIDDVIDNQTKILHAYGSFKFWDGIYNKTWENNYKKWIRMGGTPYKHRTLIGKIRRSILYRYVRKIIKLFLC